LRKQPTYQARVDERHFLNLPGHHAGAYVMAYVEDTSEREPHPYLQPRILLQIADCTEAIQLELEIGSDESYRNTMHKLDTLMGALKEMKRGIQAERKLYLQRQRGAGER
jgi:hypothetical protein